MLFKKIRMRKVTKKVDGAILKRLDQRLFYCGNKKEIDRMRLIAILVNLDEAMYVRDHFRLPWRVLPEDVVKEIRYFIEQLLREGENANADCGGPENGTGGERAADAAGAGAGLGTDL